MSKENQNLESGYFSVKLTNGSEIKVDANGIQEGDTVSLKNDAQLGTMPSNGFGFMNMFVGARFTMPSNCIVANEKAKPEFIDNATVISSIFEYTSTEGEKMKSHWSKLVCPNGLFVSFNWLSRTIASGPQSDILHESIRDDYADAVITFGDAKSAIEAYGGEELVCIGMKVDDFGAYSRKYYAFCKAEDAPDAATLAEVRNAINAELNDDEDDDEE